MLYYKCRRLCKESDKNNPNCAKCYYFFDKEEYEEHLRDRCLDIPVSWWKYPPCKDNQGKPIPTPKFTRSGVEWRDYRVNLWWGCSEVSEGCRLCRIREIVKRHKKDCWGNSPRAMRLKKAFAEIKKMNAAAERRKESRSVLVNPMCDFFDFDVVVDDRLAAWEAFKNAPRLEFIIFTKRARTLAQHLSIYGSCVPKNVHFGIVVENQQRLDERMRALDGCDVGKVSLRYAPVLGKIDIKPYADRLDWVICGAETEQNVGEFYEGWTQALRLDCRGSRIPFLSEKHTFSPNAPVDLPLFLGRYPNWHPNGHSSRDIE